MRKGLVCAVILCACAGYAQELPKAPEFLPGMTRDAASGKIVADPTAPPRTLSVCSSGCDATTIADAVATARDGEVVDIREGTFSQGAVIRASRLTLKAAPGVRLSGALTEGKAALVVKGDDTVIEGLDCSDISAPSRNGACVRQEGRNLTLLRVHFHDSEEGLLAGAQVGTITIEDSLFERLGQDGYAHGVYVGDTEALIIRRSRFLASRSEGHEVKSRAVRTTIEDSVIASMDGADSRQIDIPNGGEVTIRRTVVEKGPNSVNGQVIGYGLEGIKHETNTLALENVVLILDRHTAIPVSGPVTPVFRQVRIVGGSKPETAIKGLSWSNVRAEAGLGAYPALPTPGELKGRN